MRKNLIVLFLVVLFVAAGTVVTGTAKAALIDNGNNLIYDTVLKITWYDPAPTEMTWTYATTVWAPSLTVGGTTAGSWTLPTTPGVTFGYTNEGEMGFLYYSELGNTAGGPLAHIGVFNLLPADYWSGREYAPNTSFAWVFQFADGDQALDYKFINGYALAVHSGDVGAPVPIPGAVLLFAPGLFGLAAMRRRFRK
jgi:hypothetical protein